MGSMATKSRKTSATTKVEIHPVAAVVEEKVDAGKNEESDSSSDESSDEDESAVEVAVVEAKVEGKVARALIAPPAGYPSAAQAFESPVVVVPAAGEVEVQVECVICPTKRLKEGRMLEVHLGGKEHKKRLMRFKSHIEDKTFLPEHLTVDARAISEALDNELNARKERLRKPVSTLVPDTKKQAKKRQLDEHGELTPEAQLKRDEAKARKVHRAAVLAEKAKKMVVKRTSKKEKFDRLKKEKAEKKALNTPEISAKRLEITRLAKEKKAQKKADKAAGISKPAPVKAPKKKKLPSEKRGKKDKAAKA